MSENTFIIGPATTIEEVRNAVAAGAKIDRLTKFHLGYADAFKLPGPRFPLRWIVVTNTPPLK